MKLYKFIAVVVLYFLILFAIYLVHIKSFSVDVVFYSAICDGVFATIAIGGLLFGLKWLGCFNSFEKFQLIVICFCLGYVFAISVPTVLDRSLSFYILEKIQQRGGGIRFDKFEDVFTHEYVKEHRLVDVRITEQQESGTITIKNGCVRLTSRGKKLAKFSRFFRQNLLPKKRLLMGKYTDDLTDPFRNSENISDYECR